MTNEVDVAAARALAENATPGPWMIERHTDFEWGESAAITNVCGPIVTGEDGAIYPLVLADADFIVAARDLFPALLDALEAAESLVVALRAERDALKAELKEWDGDAIDTLMAEHNARVAAEGLLASIRRYVHGGYLPNYTLGLIQCALLGVEGSPATENDQTYIRQEPSEGDTPNA